MGCDPTGGPTETRDCVRVTELSTASATPSVTQDMVIGETGRDLYMGGVGFSQNSDLHVVWTGSSATAGDYPSTYTAYQLSGQAVNTLTGKQEITNGTAAYGGSRWGDYVIVAQDPQVPDAVWVADEYASTGGKWATEVSQLRTFAGSSYVPISPVRVMDSRSPGIGIPTPAMFTANIPQKFKVRGAFGIPTGAVAVTGNIGVVGQQVAGYVSVTPSSTTAPTTSTINFPLKDVRANNFTLPIGADGNLWAVFKGSSGKKTHLFVDITGYFVPGTSGATYEPITPVTRMGNSMDGSGGLVTFTGNKLSQQLILAGVGPIPADATAVTGNVTITRQTTGGFISVTKDAPGFPLTTSTLNFPKGDNRANGVTAALNASGGIWITLSIPTTASADVIVDITGYYKNGGGGKLFYPLTPGRPLDTRAGVVLTGLTGVFVGQKARTLPVAGHWGVPQSATAITGNITVVGQTYGGFVSVTPTASNALPATSTINFPLGDVRANGVTTPLGSGSVGLIYWAGLTKTTHLILDVTGYFQ
jgi:hypothetical protein